MTNLHTKALAAYEAMAPPTKVKLREWIDMIIAPASAIYDASSYSIKHDTESAIGAYISNEQLKGAMVAAGYEPTKSTADQLNWQFRIKCKIPAYQRPPAGQRGFAGFLRRTPPGREHWLA